MPYGRHPKNRIHSGIHTAADLLHAHNMEEITKDLAEAGALQEASTIESGTTATPNRARDTEAETTWTRLSRSNLQPPETIMEYKISSIKDISRDQDLDTTEHISDLTDTKHRIDQIGVFIQEAEAILDPSQQREYTTKINKIISETKTDLLDIEARFGNNIELNVSWTLLAYATFSTKLIFTAP